MTAAGAKNVVYLATLCWTLWLGLCLSKPVTRRLHCYGLGMLISVTDHEVGLGLWALGVEL